MPVLKLGPTSRSARPILKKIAFVAAELYGLAKAKAFSARYLLNALYGVS